MGESQNCLDGMGEVLQLSQSLMMSHMDVVDAAADFTLFDQEGNEDHYASQPVPAFDIVPQPAAGLSLRLVNLRDKWYSRKMLPEFSAEIIGPEGQLFTQTAGWLLAIDFEVKGVVDNTNFVEDESRIASVTGGVACFSSVRFTTVSSKLGALPTLAFRVLQPGGVVLQNNKSQPIRIMATRLFQNRKDSFTNRESTDAVDKLPGIGADYAKRLEAMGFATVLDIAQVPLGPDGRQWRLFIINAIRSPRGRMSDAVFVKAVEAARAIVHGTDAETSTPPLPATPSPHAPPQATPSASSSTPAPTIPPSSPVEDSPSTVDMPANPLSAVSFDTASPDPSVRQPKRARLSRRPSRLSAAHHESLEAVSQAAHLFDSVPTTPGPAAAAAGEAEPEDEIPKLPSGSIPPPFRYSRTRSMDTWMSLNPLLRSQSLSLIPAANSQLAIESQGSDFAFFESAEDSVELWPLHTAVVSGNVETCRRVVAHVLALRRSLNEFDTDNFTPLMLACFLGDAPIVELLLSYPQVDPTVSRSNGWTALHMAVLKDTAACVGALVESVPKDQQQIPTSRGWTPLMLAVRQGNVEIFHQLTASAQAESLDKQGHLVSGLNLYHMACLSGCVDTLRAVHSLLKEDVEAMDVHPTLSLMHCAAYAESRECVQWLLDHGADAAVKGDGDWTPLHVAACRGDRHTLRLLSSAPGVDPDAVTGDGSSVADLIDMAVSYSSDCLLFLDSVQPKLNTESQMQ